jgi:hypothetical protein
VIHPVLHLHVCVDPSLAEPVATGVDYATDSAAEPLHSVADYATYSATAGAALIETS